MREPCRGCAEGWRYHYWQAYDGYGRRRIHERGYWQDDEHYESFICSDQSWANRHPVYVALAIAFVALAGVIAFAAGSQP